jgi:hypothetical protein
MSIAAFKDCLINGGGVGKTTPEGYPITGIDCSYELVDL